MNLETLAEKHGIRLKYMRTGNQKITCPKCSHTRIKKEDTCMSIRVDERGIGWRCFNCNWTGGEYWDDKQPARKVAAKKINRPERRRTYGDLLREAREQWASKS